METKDHFYYTSITEKEHVLQQLFFPSILKQVQKKNYRQEKKRATKQLFSALKDPSVVIMADWLKVFNAKHCL